MIYVLIIAAIIVAVFFILKKDKKQIPQNEIRIETPSFSKVKQLRELHRYNKKVVFPLAGTHLKTAKRRFKDEIDEYFIVNIVPEPHNPKDENALAVLFDGLHLGYVPRAYQRSVNAALNSDNTLVYISMIVFNYDYERDYEFLDVNISIEYMLN